MSFFTKASVFCTTVALLVIAGACGGPRGGEKSEAGFVLKVSSVVSGTPLDGGVKVLCKSQDSTIADYKTTLDSSFSATLPKGSWNIYLVGFAGPVAWSGSTYCGTVYYDIAKDTETINITLTPANCALAIYQSMIYEGVGRFDEAHFDQEVFAP